MAPHIPTSWLCVSSVTALLIRFHHVPAAIVSVGIGLLLLGAFINAITFEREEVATLTAEDGIKNKAIYPTRPRRALIVGAGMVGRTLAASLEADGLCVVGFADDDLHQATHNPWPILGGKSSVSALIREHEVDEVFLAYAPTWQQRLVEELTDSRQIVDIRVVPSAYEALMRTARVENRGDVAVVRLTEGGGRQWDCIKRWLDTLAAAMVLTLGAPLMVLAALLVKLTSPGPVIFAQERVGQRGRSFILYKFRTMIQDAEAISGPVLSMGKQDPRLTSVGKWFRLFRVDELPQFWNVLRGEMSLVGPRPERPVFVRQFAETNPMYSLRHEVRPGITGLAQVCGGYKTDARDKLRFDLIYIAHRSLWIDLKILLRTVLVVFSSKGS